jgi:HK97 gp10 family phage protein
MKITCEVIGDADFNRKIALLATKCEGGIKNALMEGGAIIETACKELAPVDTGRLRASITHEATGDKEVIIAPHTDYAQYLEFGTSKMEAQPYMKPGFESSRDAALAHIKAKLAAEMNI